MKMLLFLLSILLLAGCDLKQPPKEGDPDLIFDITPPYDSSTALAPYDFERHKAVLDISKLQYPDPLQVDYGQFHGFHAANFFADENGSIYFTTQKEANAYKTRSELREGRAWSTASPTGHYWVATLKLLKPAAGVSSYTWMQVHGPNEPQIHNRPLIRLQWMREFRDKQSQLRYDHLWATVIVSEPGEMLIYENIDLGPRPSGFFRAAVYFKNNIMDIIINGKVIKTYNVKYWQEVQNYFKAGIYINRVLDEGEATAIFHEIYFYTQEKDVFYPHH